MTSEQSSIQYATWLQFSTLYDDLQPDLKKSPHLMAERLWLENGVQVTGEVP